MAERVRKHRWTDNDSVRGEGWNSQFNLSFVSLLRAVSMPVTLILLPIGDSDFFLISNHLWGMIIKGVAKLSVIRGVDKAY